MATELATAYISLVPSLQGAQGAIAKELGGVDAAGAGRSIGGRMGGGIMSALRSAIAPIATLFAGKAIADFANTSVAAFSELEDSTAAAGVVFGDNMGQIISQSDTAASKLGLSKQQVINAANTFGTYGKAAGLSGKELATFATEQTALAADMASFKGTSPETAIEAIGAALRGETEPIRQFGVMLDDASMRNEAMKMGLISTTKDALTPQQKTLAAQSLILKQTSDAQGDFARTSDSTANVAKTLSADFENLQAKVGEKLAPAFTAVRLAAIDAVAGLSGFIDQIPAISAEVTRVAGEILPTVQRVATVIAAVLTPVWIRLGVQAVISGAKMVAGWVMAGAGAARAAVMYVVNSALIIASWVRMGAAAVVSGAQTVAIWAMYQGAALRAAATYVATQVRIVLAWAAMSAAAVASGIRTAAVWTGTIIASAATGTAAFVASTARVVAGWVLMGVQAMIQAVRMAAAWFIALGPIGWVTAAVIAIVALVIANWSKVSAWTAQAWAAVTGFVTRAWQAIVNWVTLAINRVRMYITAGWNAVRVVTSVVFNAVRSFLQSVWSGIVGFVTGYINRVRAIITAGWNAARAVTSAVFNGIRSVVTSVFGAIRGFISGVVGTVRSVISGGFNAARNAVSGAMNGARSIVSSVWNGIVGTVRNTVSNVISAVTGIKGRIVGALAGAGSWLVSVGRNIIQGLIDGVGGMIDNAVQAVKNVGGSMLSGVQDFLGIKSPSRRFRFEVGQQVGEGVVLGVQDKISDAQRALSQLTAPPARVGFDTASIMAEWARTSPAPDPVGDVYVQNPFTGEYMLARMDARADSRINAADADAGRRRIG